MKCEKCGKEIPDGENKICNDCKKKLVSEINSNVEDKKITKAKKNKLPLIIVLILCILVLTFLILKETEKGMLVLDKIFYSNEVGNTIANIRNYGYCASQGNFIYYIAPVGDKGNTGIYRARKDGSNQILLYESEGGLSSLNVKGGYIYFIAMTNEKIESASNLTSTESIDDLDNKICRIKIDGKGFEIINSNEFHNNCYDMYLIGNKIYYIGTDSNIWHMDLDGTNKTKLNDEGTGYIGISKDYIVFNILKSNSSTENVGTTTTSAIEYETCIMNIDGTNKHSLIGKRMYSVIIKDDYIYYVDENKKIHKIKVDGTDDTVILEGTEAYNMNMSENYIYYMNYTDETQEFIAIYRVDLDGKNNKEIYRLANYSAFLNVVNGNVVFMDSDKEAGTINMINENGDNKVELYRHNYSLVSTVSNNDENSVNTNSYTQQEESNKAE